MTPAVEELNEKISVFLTWKQLNILLSPWQYNANRMMGCCDGKLKMLRLFQCSKGLGVTTFLAGCWGYWTHRDRSVTSPFIPPPPTPIHSFSLFSLSVMQLAGRLFCPSPFLLSCWQRQKIRLKTDREDKRESSLQFKDLRNWNWFWNSAKKRHLCKPRP